MKYFLVLCFGTTQTEDGQTMNVQSIVLVEAESFDQAVNIIQFQRQEAQLPLFDNFANASIHQMPQDAVNAVEQTEVSGELETEPEKEAE